MRKLHPRKQVHSIETLESRWLLANAVAGVGSGLVANYFSDQELQNLALTRVDPTVDFQWGSASPGAGVPADNFSARWIGKVQAQFTESYTFYINSDEGVALWVNGQQVIDNFTDHTLDEDTGTISLKAGELYDIRLEYYDNAFDATMQLSWSSPSTAKAIIPATQLYGDAGWTSGGWLNNSIGGAGGGISSTGSQFNVNGGGPGTAGTSDGFQYLYQTLQGDGTIVAKVQKTEGSNGGAEAGVMIRETLGAGAAYATVVVDSLGRPSFETRGATNQTSQGTIPPNPGSGQYWIKLVRDGNFYRGYASTTGTESSWVYFGARNIPMGRTVYVGLTATSGGNGGLNHAQFKNVSVLALPPLGAGLDAVRDWSFGQVFTDIARQSREFTVPNLGPAVAIDANGWPMADFMSILMSGFPNMAHILNGTYKGRFNGQADMNTWVTPGGQIKNKVYDAGTNTTTFEFVVNAAEAATGWYGAINFLNTRRTAGSALGTGITNFKLMRPGYDFNTTTTFRPEYLEHLKTFSTLRFMDWTGTNNSTIVDWSERTTTVTARQSSTKGVAWEYVVELANLLDKDVWVNIPVKANDAYIQQLAQYLKDNIEPDRAVYVEYSNEIWNGIFTQYMDNLNLARAEVAAGGSPLNSDGQTIDVYWGWRRTAKRLKEISDIFGNAFGASQINGRVRPVLAAQHANPEVIRQGLEFIERTYGSPSKYFYGIAQAPYFAFGNLDDSSNSLTVDQIINALSNSVNSQKYFTFGSYARRYGLQPMVYEGGPDTFGPNNVDNKIAASLDPRMKDLVTKYLYDWYKAGGGLFEWFVAGPTNWDTSFGSWGLSNHLDNFTSPKYLGAKEVATTPRQALTYGNAGPGTFDARAIAGATLPYLTTYQPQPGKGNSIDYFVRVPKGGTYKLILNGATNGTNEQLMVRINGSATRTITLIRTNSATANFTDNLVGNFRLEEGMNLIRITSINQTSWNLQTVTIARPDAPSGTPTVVNAAAASPNPVTNKTTNLSVLGDDDGGAANLTYSWEAVDEQPMTVTFSANGTNAAKNTTATFTRAGAYTLRCTISDGVSSTTSSVVVTVNQVITTVTVAPTGMAIANGESQQLVATAKDQFAIQLYTQPTFTWSVDNGFGTVSSTGLYTSPASGLSTATVRATIGGISGTATVVTESPRVPDVVANPLPGLLYQYYEGSWTAVPNFDSLTPIKTGVSTNLSLTPKNVSNNFGFQFTGYVFVPGTGTYTFYTTSDDGSKLWIGTKLVVNNDGPHGVQERSGTIILDAGWHEFKLGYFDVSGSETLSASFSGPGLAGKVAIPNSNFQRSNKAPTISTPVAASPNPISGNNSDLTVVGADESGESALTYTWSATAKPAGANNPVFSLNGTNTAKNSNVTFSKAGIYTIQVAISDGNLITTSSINITVNATVTSINLSPTNPTVKQLHTRQFSATAFDQFGNAISGQPFDWSASVNGGTIDSSGLYTAPQLVGDYTVTAAIGSVTRSTTVNVIADPSPTVATPASASAVVDDQSTLNVLGDDDSGEMNLTYTWAATLAPAGANLLFSINGTNAAKETIVTFDQPGDYQFTVTISDGYTSTTSTVDVAVTNDGAPSVVTPASATPSPVTGTTTQLSVLADDDDGEANLTYTWATTGTPPAAVGFSDNGTNSAKSATATFTKAGSYDFVVSISDGTHATTSTVTVVVNQTLTSIALSPTSAIVTQNNTRQFTATAKDQFGDTLSSPPTFTWSVTSTGAGGTVSQSGLYTAPGGTPTDTVHAASGAIEGTAIVTVVAAGPSPDTFGGTSQDIGGPTLAGSYTYSGGSGVYTVKASGADIWGTADQFHYVYKPWTGDGTIIARVASVQNTHSRAKAGVMFRETLAAGSKNVNFVIAPDNTTSFQYRTQTNSGMSTQNMSNSPAPYYLKLVRAGNLFTGYRSPDGVTWTQVGSITVTMGTSIYVGLSLTSHNNAQLNTSTFDHVSVSSSTSFAAQTAASKSSLTTSTSTMAKKLKDVGL